MKNNSLDEIVKCNIDISSPVSGEETFDKILLVVPKPETTGEKTMSKVTTISKADELLDYGFTTEDDAYVAATVAFSQSPSPDELRIYIRQTIEATPGENEDEPQEGENGDEPQEGTEVENGEAVAETSAEQVYENIATTLARANTEAEFYGFHITSFKDPEDVNAAIAWAEANEKVFAFEYDDYDSCPVTNFSYFRTIGVYSGNADGYSQDEQPEVNQYAALAWMSKCFGYDPGSETWHLKELATIVPSALSKEQKKELEEKHINTFLRYAGANCTIGGYTLAGEWIDVIRFRDWIKSDMQTRVFNALKANRKVPFTDNGIGMIEGAMEASLKEGQNIGGIALTEYDADGNEIPGFEVYVPKASDLTEGERKSRKLPGCRYTAKLSGAIHLVDIEGFLTF